jgi:hypothetical protein
LDERGLQVTSETAVGIDQPVNCRRKRNVHLLDISILAPTLRWPNAALLSPSSNMPQRSYVDGIKNT